MVRSFMRFGKNQAAVVITEPMWGIPFFLYAPFMGVYMYSLGVSYRQIGLIASVVMFLQVFTSLIGGVVTDRYGRRMTVLAVDILAWSVPCIVWMLAKNFWFFLIAAVLNSFWQISSNAWACVIAEDADESAISDIYAWIYISGQLVVFFAPFSAMLVKRLTVVPAMRVLFLFAFVMMTLKFVVMYAITYETGLGKQRMAETKNNSVFKLFKDFLRGRYAFDLKSPDILLTLLLMIIFNITSATTSSFFGLYIVNRLSIPEQYLAYYPIARAAIFLLFMFFIQKRLERFSTRFLMLAGAAAYIVSHACLIFVPFGKNASVLLYILAEACAFAVFMPRREALLVSVLAPETRPVMLSLMNCAMLAASMPFGYIGGYLSGIDQRLPFYLNMVLFSVAIFILFRFKRLAR